MAIRTILFAPERLFSAITSAGVKSATYPSGLGDAFDTALRYSKFSNRTNQPGYFASTGHTDNWELWYANSAGSGTTDDIEKIYTYVKLGYTHRSNPAAYVCGTIKVNTDNNSIDSFNIRIIEYKQTASIARDNFARYADVYDSADVRITRVVIKNNDTGLRTISGSGESFANKAFSFNNGTRDTVLLAGNKSNSYFHQTSKADYVKLYFFCNDPSCIYHANTAPNMIMNLPKTRFYNPPTYKIKFDNSINSSGKGVSKVTVTLTNKNIGANTTPSVVKMVANGTTKNTNPATFTGLTPGQAYTLKVTYGDGVYRETKSQTMKVAYMTPDLWLWEYSHGANFAEIDADYASSVDYDVNSAVVTFNNSGPTKDILDDYGISVYAPLKHNTSYTIKLTAKDAVGTYTESLSLKTDKIFLNKSSISATIDADNKVTVVSKWVAEIQKTDNTKIPINDNAFKVNNKVVTPYTVSLAVYPATGTTPITNVTHTPKNGSNSTEWTSTGNGLIPGQSYKFVLTYNDGANTVSAEQTIFVTKQSDNFKITESPHATLCSTRSRKLTLTWDGTNATKCDVKIYTIDGYNSNDDPIYATTYTGSALTSKSIEFNLESLAHNTQYIAIAELTEQNVSGTKTASLMFTTPLIDSVYSIDRTTVSSLEGIIIKSTLDNTNANRLTFPYSYKVSKKRYNDDGTWSFSSYANVVNTQMSQTDIVDSITGYRLGVIVNFNNLDYDTAYRYQYSISDGYNTATFEMEFVTAIKRPSILGISKFERTNSIEILPFPDIGSTYFKTTVTCTIIAFNDESGNTYETPQEKLTVTMPLLDEENAGPNSVALNKVRLTKLRQNSTYYIRISISDNNNRESGPYTSVYKKDDVDYIIATTPMLSLKCTKAIPWQSLLKASFEPIVSNNIKDNLSIYKTTPEDSEVAIPYCYCINTNTNEQYHINIDDETSPNVDVIIAGLLSYSDYIIKYGVTDGDNTVIISVPLKTVFPYVRIYDVDRGTYGVNETWKLAIPYVFLDNHWQIAKALVNKNNVFTECDGILNPSTHDVTNMISEAELASICTLERLENDILVSPYYEIITDSDDTEETES